MILIWFNQVTIIVAKAIDGMMWDIIGLLIYCYFPPITPLSLFWQKAI